MYGIGDEMKDLEEQLKSANKEIAALKAHIGLIDHALTDKVVDLIRCGIGGNYSGRYYDKALEDNLTPIIEVRKQTPAQSLTEHNKRVILGMKPTTDMKHTFTDEFSFTTPNNTKPVRVWVPWNTCKDIWLSMNEYYANNLTEDK